ncbi:CdaR family protein [Aliicoccus persicus]|uniref:YbbR domain-containing protein n=1 Tax=Aliicoccus persicus TaxID=930138 RepID=A0A662Z6F2_9STAP|nr:CdaR family protein [Aliicoccus persicus]SEV99053.1 YbbR domain-containing protein [Aliicoccus persicus]
MLESKLGISIVTLILAIFLFLSVNDIFDALFSEDEEMYSEVVENVPVNVKYDQENYYVMGAPEHVSVELFGSLANVTRVQTLGEFNVVLDLRNRDAGDYEEFFRVENLPSNVTAEVLPQTVSISKQELVSRTYEIHAEVSESRIPLSHSLDAVTTEPQTVVVRGGESEMNRIQYVRATISDTSRITSSQVEEAEVNVFDYQFNRLDVSVEPSTVNVQIDVSERSKEVPIEYTVTGQVPDGYTLENIELDTEELTIFGSENSLNMHSNYVVEIDVTGLTESTTREIEITLPEELIKTEPTTIMATIEIEETNE